MKCSWNLNNDNYEYTLRCKRRDEIIDTTFWTYTNGPNAAVNADNADSGFTSKFVFVGYNLQWNPKNHRIKLLGAQKADEGKYFCSVTLIKGGRATSTASAPRQLNGAACMCVYILSFVTFVSLSLLLSSFHSFSSFCFYLSVCVFPFTFLSACLSIYLPVCMFFYKFPIYLFIYLLFFYVSLHLYLSYATDDNSVSIRSSSLCNRI